MFFFIYYQSVNVVTGGTGETEATNPIVRTVIGEANPTLPRTKTVTTTETDTTTTVVLGIGGDNEEDTTGNLGIDRVIEDSTMDLLGTDREGMVVGIVATMTAPRGEEMIDMRIAEGEMIGTGIVTREKDLAADGILVIKTGMVAVR